MSSVGHQEFGLPHKVMPTLNEIMKTELPTHLKGSNSSSLGMSRGSRSLSGSGRDTPGAGTCPTPPYIALRSSLLLSSAAAPSVDVALRPRRHRGLRNHDESTAGSNSNMSRQHPDHKTRRPGSVQAVQSINLSAM